MNHKILVTTGNRDFFISLRDASVWKKGRIWTW